MRFTRPSLIPVEAATATLADRSDQVSTSPMPSQNVMPAMTVRLATRLARSPLGA